MRAVPMAKEIADDPPVRWTDHGREYHTILTTKGRTGNNHGKYYIEVRIKCLNLRLRSTSSCRTRCSITLLLQFRHSLAYCRRWQETPA